MATVYKRNRTYWVRFHYGGEEIRRSAQTSSKTIAQQYLAKLLEEHRRIGRGERSRHTYKEALARFYAEYLPGLKPKTQERYRGSLRRFEPYVGHLHLDQITKTVLADYVSARRAQGVTGATIRRDLATLSSVCSFAQAVDMVEINPVKAFSKRHIREAKPKTSYPTDAQIEALITQAPKAMKLPIRFLAQTGMRTSEAISMEWSQVDLVRREVLLTKTKTSAPRTVPLSQAAYETLLACPRHPVSRLVFWHGRQGSPYRQFSSHFGRLARKVGFPFRAHDLRHRFASVFLQATGNLPALQAVLGHRSIEMTLRYSHLVTAHLHEAIARAGTKLGTSTPKLDEKPLDQPTLSLQAPASFGFAPSWNVQVQRGPSYGEMDDGRAP